MKKFLLFVILFCSGVAQAGYFEISGSGSYRKTSQDKNTFTTYKSVTGSVAYYFWELSALEVSYTRARQDDSNVDYNDTSFQEFFETDLIFTLAKRESFFQPYIKIGAAYQIKKTSYKQVNQSPIDLPVVRGWGPSGGIGFKLMISQILAIKAGIDAWSSPLNQDPVTYDYAARAGLSIIF